MRRWPWRSGRDTDLREEIDTHLSLLEEQYRRDGMSPRDAADAARRAFGGELKTRHAYREQRWGPWLAALALDAGSAVRTLARRPRAAAIPVLVLGLGIGANTMIFTLGYSHTMRGLPIADADRVLMASYSEAGNERQLSWPEFDAVRSGATAMADVAALGATVAVSVSDQGRAPDRYQATYVTASAFAVVQRQPLVGRVFDANEERPDGPRVALLGAGLWNSRYARDPAVVGREVLINGQPVTVVGVMPSSSGVPSTAEVWLPATHAQGFTATDRAARTIRAFGRVRPGAALDTARAELETLLARSASEIPGTRLQPSVTTINARYFGSPTTGVWLAFFTSGFLVLVVSSANVANIMLARSTSRTREMAIRGSLGASRARLFTQLIIESMAIAGAGAAIGLLLSRIGVNAFRAQIPGDVLPYWLDYSLNAAIFGFFGAFAFGTVLVFGVLPALQGSRIDTIKVLRDGGWGASGRLLSRHLTTAFMTLQLGLGVVLLAYTVTNSFGDDPPASDRALSTGDVLTASLALSGERYRTPEQRAALFDTARERIAAAPGVTSVAITTPLPRTGAIDQRLQLTAGPVDNLERLPSVATVSISPGFFATLNVPLVHGREFDEHAATNPPAAIVNARFVSTFLAGTLPLDREITLIHPVTKAARTFRIVGVADDIRHRATVEPVAYVPISITAPSNAFLVVRKQVDTAAMTTALRDAMMGIDPYLPVFSVRTLARAMYDAEWNPRVSVRLVTTLMAIVLVLAGVGLSATAAQAVSQRSKEIGIRVAVGARPAAVGRLILGRAALQIVFGFALGIACTVAWDAAFFSGSSTTRFTNPQVLLPIAGVQLLIMTVACIVPLRRALGVDPVVVLRQD